MFVSLSLASLASWTDILHVHALGGKMPQPIRSQDNSLSLTCRTLENYAKWIITWQLKEVFLPYSSIRESLVLFRQMVLGKPSMDQQQECVSTVEEALPLALGRVYAQYILPDGFKVSVCVGSSEWVLLKYIRDTRHVCISGGV